jgi:hypothetical protein
MGQLLGSSYPNGSRISDRAQLEQGEARMLYGTWKMTGQKVMTEIRLKWIKRIYGPEAIKRIEKYMMEMHRGERE